MRGQQEYKKLSNLLKYQYDFYKTREYLNQSINLSKKEKLHIKNLQKDTLFSIILTVLSPDPEEINAFILEIRNLFNE